MAIAFGCDSRGGCRKMLFDDPLRRSSSICRFCCEWNSVEAQKKSKFLTRLKIGKKKPVKDAMEFRKKETESTKIPLWPSQAQENPVKPNETQ